MNNLEDNLRKIKVKELAKEDKDSLWHSIMVGRVEEENNKSRLIGFNIFNFSMKKIIVGFVALVLILGGSGVVAASNNAVPGSFLFPVELALENIQLKLSGDDKKEELRLRFTEERLEEIRHVSEKRSVASNALVADLSAATVLQIEADVFTNETTVEIEANDKHYGYISALKTKAELVKEIALKYSITEAKVNSVIDFEVEDRASRADDKGFLNKNRSINFSQDESDDVSQALSDIEKFLADNGDDKNNEELKKSLASILVLLGDDGKMEIRREDGRIKIETKDGEVKIEMKSGDDDSRNSSDDSNDDDSDDDGNDDNGSDDSDDSVSGNDVREDDSEVFCRGEWRDAEDCDDSDDDEDSSGNSGSSDDSDDDEDNSGGDDDSDDDNSGSGKDDDKDDDNSGSGGGDDDN